jgi:transposase
MRRAYQSDLSDPEWEVLKPHLPLPQAPGRPRLHPLREIVDAVFYVLRGGCAWRLLPHDFPPWKTVSPLLPPLATRWYVGAAARSTPPQGTSTPREGPSPRRRHRRFPERQNYRDRRERARLRSREEGAGKKAAFAGGYAGFGDESEGPCGECLRPRRDKVAGGSSLGSGFRASLICGSMLATTAKGKAETTGPRRRWALAWRS